MQPSDYAFKKTQPNKQNPCSFGGDFKIVDWIFLKGLQIFPLNKQFYLYSAPRIDFRYKKGNKLKTP